MQELGTFPFPTTGKTCVEQIAADTIEVRCSGINTTDYRTLLGFFNTMMGRFRTFQFEHGPSSIPHCRFDTDSAPFVKHGPDNFSVALPVKILPA